MRASVHRLGMAHPGDLSQLAALFDAGTLDPRHVCAVIGKTEGNGGVNDFTRGYFTLAFSALLAERSGRPRAEILDSVPCVLSGGTEGVLSPHYLVFAREAVEVAPVTGQKRLAIGVAFSPAMPPEQVGCRAHVDLVVAAVQQAMADAGIDDPADVHFVQVKAPCVTAARAQEAAARGAAVLTAESGRSMAYARVAGAFGVALALGDAPAARLTEDAMFRDYDLQSDRASISSGVEVACNEVILLGNSAGWSGDLAIAHRPMADALDIGGVSAVLGDLGLAAAPQLSAADAARIHGVLVKCEPDRRGALRGNRHTMLDDTDINAQRHIRGAVGGLVAGIIGDGRIFVSGGAEHQGPDGGGLIAVIARV
ncbi:cyanuric acid amidohydrolase [Ferrovibrio xuzhouensis]|uniref:Cyclic amide hydrolase n=1 Tax=Ferrovibrio xuzhouensis TaxID=1576914 RepID=A0ABV7VGP0_9PROT